MSAFNVTPDAAGLESGAESPLVEEHTHGFSSTQHFHPKSQAESFFSLLFYLIFFLKQHFYLI